MNNRLRGVKTLSHDDYSLTSQGILVIINKNTILVYSENYSQQSFIVVTLQYTLELYSCDLCDYIGITSDFKTRAEIIEHLKKKHDDVKSPYQDYFSNQ